MMRFSLPVSRGSLTPVGTRIVSSGFFKFVVGPGKREFFIHSALVAFQSPSLKVLVDGRMQEAIDQRVEWGETDEMTFVLFSQFAYTGNYDGQEQRPSQPLRDERQASPFVYTGTYDGQGEQEAEYDNWGVKLASSKKKKKGSRSFGVPISPVAEPSSGALSTVLPSRFKDQCPDALCDHDAVSWSDGREVLLIHARMYTFADYHGITKLQTLALRKLHRILMQFELSDESIRSIVELVRHTYEHTRADPDDRLRSMISMYGACKLLEFRGNKDFDFLLRTVGEFSGDLFQKISMQ